METLDDFLPQVWFCTLALFLFLHVIPTEITIYTGSRSSKLPGLQVDFVGFLIPIILFYNIYQYVVFRGKISGEASMNEA